MIGTITDDAIEAIIKAEGKEIDAIIERVDKLKTISAMYVVVLLAFTLRRYLMTQCGMTEEKANQAIIDAMDATERNVEVDEMVLN